MKLLGWDTSSKTGAFVAMEWDKESQTWDSVHLITEMTMNVDSTHSERLLWGVHQMLESARWRLEDVDFFGVGVGPGSFTGLRIGLTTARTLAHTLNKPLVGVSSLAALARPVALQYSQKTAQPLVVAMTDACKGEFFALWGDAKSVAQCSAPPSEGQGGLWKKTVSEKVIEPQALVDQLNRRLNRKSDSKKKTLPWIVVGEGRKRFQNKYGDFWSDLPVKTLIEEESLIFSDQIQGRYLGQLLWESVQAGVYQQGLHIYPRYLRVSDAELKLQKSQANY